MKNEFTYSHLCEKDNPNESFIHSFNKLNKVAFKSFDEFEKWYVSKLMNYGGIKMFEIYEDEKGIGIRSNAKDEREFLEWASKLISRIIFEKKSIQRLVQNPEFKNEHEKAIEKRLKNFFPKIVEICCKYRGYKAEVTEQRVLIAGQILGGDPQFSLDEKTK